MDCSLFATFVVGQFFFRSADTGGNVAVPIYHTGNFGSVHRRGVRKSSSPRKSKHEESDDNQWSGGDLKNCGRTRCLSSDLSPCWHEVAEISINNYFINFVTGQNWMDDRTASIVLTCALAFFMVGDSWAVGLCAMWEQRRHCSFVLYARWFALHSCYVTWNISLGALFCNYLFEAIMFHFSRSSRALGNLTKSASSILMMTPVGRLRLPLDGSDKLITPIW